MTAVVDREHCAACGECLSACPLDAILIEAQPGGRALIDDSVCGACGVCINICPRNAIALLSGISAETAKIL